MKSLEQKLFQAIRNKTGVTLSKNDVEILVHDYEIDTHIVEQARLEAGVEVASNCILRTDMTWNQYVKHYRELG